MPLDFSHNVWLRFCIAFSILLKQSSCLFVSVFSLYIWFHTLSLLYKSLIRCLLFLKPDLGCYFDLPLIVWCAQTTFIIEQNKKKFFLSYCLFEAQFFILKELKEVYKKTKQSSIKANEMINNKALF